MRLAATIILYNPNRKTLSHIQSFLNHVEKLYIVDNSNSSSISNNDINSTKIEIIHDGENQGIAKRINQIIEKCVKEGYTHLLTMDQDSFFEKDHFKKYKDEFEKTENSKIGMIGLIHDSREISETNEDNSILITSGSIVNIEIAIKIGLFDENIFIDGVDTEFCLRLIKKGYKTILIKNIILQHNLGESISAITPFFQKSNRSLHSSNRIYYIVRNHFYIRNKYKTQANKIPHLPILNEIKNAVFYGDEKIRSLIAVFKGYQHFLLNKMGKQT